MPSGDTTLHLQQLLDRHRRGEESATQEILAFCQVRLKTLTRQMLQKFPGVQEWEETSDVFHNVVLRLLDALRSLQFETPLDFLKLSAKHIRWELIDLSRKRRPDLERLNANCGSFDDVRGPTEDPFNLALWHDVHERIGGLSDESRLLFDLLYYQGLSQPDAAELLAVPLRTLKRNWQKARAELMVRLDNQTPF